MAGDATKAGRWSEADVWVAPLGTTPPTDIDTDPATGWDLIGYLDGDAGVVKSLDEDSSTLKAWGGVPIEDVSTFNGESFAFTAVEDNDVVWMLLYPGSAAPTTATGTTTRVASVPNRVPQAWLIRLTRGDGTKKQYLITKGVGRPTSDITENETDLSGVEITVNVLANSSNELHTETIKAAV
jgi:hypothetical protein